MENKKNANGVSDYDRFKNREKVDQFLELFKPFFRQNIWAYIGVFLTLLVFQIYGAKVVFNTISEYYTIITITLVYILIAKFVNMFSNNTNNSSLGVARARPMSKQELYFQDENVNYNVVMDSKNILYDIKMLVVKLNATLRYKKVSLVEMGVRELDKMDITKIINDAPSENPTIIVIKDLLLPFTSDQKKKIRELNANNTFIAVGMLIFKHDDKYNTPDVSYIDQNFTHIKLSDLP